MRDELPVALSLELDDSPTDEETLFLARQINEYNFETTDIRDGRELMKPVAVAVDESQTVYVADTLKGEVLAFDRAGQVSRRFKPAGRSNYRPVSVAFLNPNGTTRCGMS